VVSLFTSDDESRYTDALLQQGQFTGPLGILDGSSFIFGFSRQVVMNVNFRKDCAQARGLRFRVAHWTLFNGRTREVYGRIMARGI
jgi:hypothetical protein